MLQVINWKNPTGTLSVSRSFIYSDVDEADVIQVWGGDETGEDHRNTGWKHNIGNKLTNVLILRRFGQKRLLDALNGNGNGSGNGIQCYEQEVESDNKTQENITIT